MLKREVIVVTYQVAGAVLILDVRGLSTLA